VRIENENTFKQALASGINLFLGAGFSVKAEGTFKDKPKPMPVGDGLRQEILEKFGRSSSSSLSLSQLCQIIVRTQKAELESFFRSRFKTVSFDSRYHNLERLNIRSIFTTNIDDLIFKIFEGSQKYYINDVSLRGPSIVGASAIDYIALHGSIVHAPEEGLDFSPVEIASSFERDHDKWFGYIDRIKKTPTLYWGYSMADAGVLQALSRESVSVRDRASSWVTLRAEDEEAIEYYSSLGFQIVVAETHELLAYIGQLKAPPASSGSGKGKRLVDKRFAEYLIPSVDRVPVRSLTDFYLGAEATWYDIFLGDLHRTAHFSSARNAIAGGKSCLLIGASVSGKSTLLRLLANNLPEGVQPFYIDEITPEKARLLVKDIDAEGVKCVMFIDDAADASDSIGIFSASSNVQIVGAERDYIFDSVAHRFPRKKFEIINVSGLSAFDVQAVEDKIPAGIRRVVGARQNNPLHVDFDPTFFEVLDTRIEGHFLADRFFDALQRLRRDAPVNHSLLLLACYLYACRIPLSVDVASSYLARQSMSPNAVFDALGSMDTLLSRYEGGLADSNQAFFVPRSRSVAEAVMRKVEPAELSELLKRFHADVSPTKIPRYDIFRRMAYDANLTGRAFPEWQDGVEFYEAAFRRDPTHSLKQQAAIYLSRKRQYPLAFRWIDEARSIAGNRAASVKNTYAVILFSANYDKPAEAPGVQSSLEESMEILQKCHSEDLRKIYHAKVFGDQAIKFKSKFPRSPRAAEYIDLAVSWLEAELKVRDGDRSIVRLLRDLRSARRY